MRHQPRLRRRGQELLLKQTPTMGNRNLPRLPACSSRKADHQLILDTCEQRASEATEHICASHRQIALQCVCDWPGEKLGDLGRDWLSGPGVRRLVAFARSVARAKGTHDLGQHNLL